MNSRGAFVAVGLAVNLLVLARGVILMLALGYADLGLVALVQAAVTFTGLLHFGLLNGGYRLLCHAGARTQQRIIDLAYTAFAGIAAGVSLAALGLALTLEDAVLRAVAGLAAIGGVATLLRAWIMNELVARQRLRAANRINAVSIAASLAVLALLLPGASPLAPALIAVGAIVVQPVLFAALALATGAAMRPRSLRAPRRLARIIFKAGFVLFLTGLAIQFMTLVERAYVSGELGLEPLGRLYLSFLFLTLFQMVPNLVQQVFLPAMVRHWKARDASAVSRELRALLGLTAAYCLAAALALWIAAEPLLTIILPDYVPDLRWVYILTPGLIAFALSGPFALTFNVVIDYRWYLIAYGAGVAVTLAAFGAALAMVSPLNLDQVIALRSGVYALMAALLVLGWWRLSARSPEFRLLPS
ncbi:MAG: hypothetical protein QNI87_07725 [Erythrobacter sp.]|uniref:lipopolysaccharide biosynthesis protein n=1 Tax=Erythrobacter sp. TaxID=1042 RepID=UPI00263565F4|nr:hypothetical protein [Erythrobacter sp.]MDJ0978410.1 hypothetical protein [Erythrobacter sp.]